MFFGRLQNAFAITDANSPHALTLSISNFLVYTSVLNGWKRLTHKKQEQRRSSNKAARRIIKKKPECLRGFEAQENI